MPSDRGELLSVVDQMGRPANAAPRDVVHRDGLWHESFHCLLIRGGSPSTVLLQRRRRDAAAFGGLLDLTVTGHLRAGEQPSDGVREVREELGLDVDPDRLVPLGRRTIIDDGGEGINREWAHVFLLVENRPLHEFHVDDVDDADIDGLVEVSIDDALGLLASPARPCVARELRRDGTLHEVRIEPGELVPQLDGYWTVLMVMAERHLAGLTPIAI